MKATLKSAADKFAVVFSPDRAPEETDVLNTLKKEHDEVQELLTNLLDSDKAALIPLSKAEEKIAYDTVISAKSQKNKNQIDGAEGYQEYALAS